MLEEQERIHEMSAHSRALLDERAAYGDCFVQANAVVPREKPMLARIRRLIVPGVLRTLYCRVKRLGELCLERLKLKGFIDNLYLRPVQASFHGLDLYYRR